MKEDLKYWRRFYKMFKVAAIFFDLYNKNKIYASFKFFRF